MKHVMLDLETMGSSAGCAIVSIGAVEFSYDRDCDAGALGKEFYINVNLQSCLDVGMRVDGNTVMWWLEQGDLARRALLFSPIKIHAALGLFSKFLDQNDTVLWSHGASFDLSILSAAFRMAGIMQPWKYRNERDTRTILDITGLSMPANADSAHHALEDAKRQAHVMIEAFRKISKTKL